MDNKYIFTIFISLCIVFYFIIFVLEIKLSNLINTSGLENLLHKLNIKDTFSNMRDPKITIQYPPLQKYDEKNILDTPELLNMAVINNNNTTRLMAHNEDIEEENSADFKNQATNIDEFIKQNKSLLYDNTRHNIHSAVVNEWNLKGAQLFNKILNNKTTSIEPYTTNIYALYN
jgi:hypothetical protein